MEDPTQFLGIALTRNSLGSYFWSGSAPSVAVDVHRSDDPDNCPPTRWTVYLEFGEIPVSATGENLLDLENHFRKWINRFKHVAQDVNQLWPETSV